MFQIKVVDKIKTHILCSVTSFFSENRAVCEVMWKQILNLGRTRTAHALWVLDNQGYARTHTHTQTASNNYCFPNATMFARTPFGATLHVHCLSRIHVALLTFLYSINRMVFVTETERVECAGGTECSTINQAIVFPLTL